MRGQNDRLLRSRLDHDELYYLSFGHPIPLPKGVPALNAFRSDNFLIFVLEAAQDD